MSIGKLSPEQSPPREPGSVAQADTLATFAAAISLFTAGVVLGGLAGRLNHAFAAVALVLPVVGWAAYLYPQRVSGVIAFGAMASWAVTRQAMEAEPFWSIVFTFTMSLLILFGTGWLVEALMSARDRAQHYAQTEPMTGLLNRNTFLDQLQQEIDRSRRHARPLAVAFLDCDDFKAWNDQHGHLAGDDFLRLIANALTRYSRDTDAVARMGGDEFAVLFLDMPPRQADAAIRRLHDNLREALQGQELPVTVSAGLVAFERPPSAAREVIATADALMYSAKSLGRDRVITLLDPPIDTVTGKQFKPDDSAYELATT